MTAFGRMGGAMNIENNYDLTYLVNDTERLVFEELGQILEEEQYKGVCICQDCVIDMATLALNRLEPRYHASLLGTIYAQSADNEQYTEKVREAVHFAVKKVSSNPAHS